MPSRTTTTPKTKRPSTTKAPARSKRAAATKTPPAVRRDPEIVDFPTVAAQALAWKFLDGTLEPKVEGALLVAHLDVMVEAATFPAPADRPNWPALASRASVLAGAFDLEAKRTGDDDAAHELAARAWQLARDVRALEPVGSDDDARAARGLAQRLARTPSLRSIAESFASATGAARALAADSLRARLAHEAFAALGACAGNLYVPSTAAVLGALDVYPAATTKGGADAAA